MAVSESDAARKRRLRAADRDVRIPSLSPADRAERLRREADDALWLESYWSAFSPDTFYPLSPQQLQMVDDFRAALEYGGDRATAASRGEGKTSFAVALTLKEILRGGVDFAILLGATAPNASNMLETLSTALAENEELRHYYPEVCVPIAALEYTAQRAGKQTVSGDRFDTGEPFEMARTAFHWAGNKLIFPNVPGSPSAGAIVISQGLDSALRGCKIRNKRPRIVIIDDPDTDDTTYSADQAAKLLTKIDRGIAALGSQQRPVTRLVLVTVASAVSVAAKITDRAVYPSFRGRRFRFLLTPPNNTALWDQFVALCKQGWTSVTEDHDTPPIPLAAHRLYLENREAMDLGAEVSNPNRYDHRMRPEGGTVEVSALEHYHGWVARIGPESTSTEFDNDPPKIDSRFETKLTWLDVSNCSTEFLRGQVDPTTTAIVRAVDVRKIELHHAAIASDVGAKYRIPDYGLQNHGTSETTVEQAESLILESLRRLAKSWEVSPFVDENGMLHNADLTLIDKGWMGSWTEDGQMKTWVSQPVETFCLEAGVDRFLPAKGAPNYQAPAPDRMVIIGDNWHINRGPGKLRRCDEVIWNADHWHLLVEELFLLPEGSRDKFELFAPEEGTIWTNHKALGAHIETGARLMKEQMAKGTKSKKPRFVRDHWWDALAMCLVGMSIVAAKVERASRQRPRMTLAQMAQAAGRR